MKELKSRRRETVLFDLDGVIISSEEQKSEAHIQTVLKLGGRRSQKLSELYVDVIGLSYEETRDRFLECGGIPATPDIQASYRGIYGSIYHELLQGVNLTPGARQLLQALTDRRYRVGLVSSAHLEEVKVILGRHEIAPFFEAIVSADSVENHKPAPDPYLKALEVLGLGQTPHLAVAFEDTRAGISAAQAAGLKVFAVRHRHNRKQNFTGAERIFDSLADDRILPTIEASLP